MKTGAELALEVVTQRPRTSEEVATALKVSRATAKRWLRAAIDAGTVEKRTRFFGRLAYTWVYRPKQPQPEKKP